MHAAFARLEAWVFSDRALEIKRCLTWLLLLLSLFAYGLGAPKRLPPGLLQRLEAPAAFDQQEIRLAFYPVLQHPSGDYYLRTEVGFVLLQTRETLQDLPGPFSVRGTWSRGVVTATELWGHPLRALKGRLSLLVLLFLFPALFWRYRQGLSLHPSA